MKWTAAAIAAAVVLGAGGYCAMVGYAVFRGVSGMTTNEGTALRRDKLGELLDTEAFYTQYRVEELAIPSRQSGHGIPADFITPIGGAGERDTAIIVHGLGGNRLSVYPIAELFLSLGYNALVYDQRASGENLARYNTFGRLESYDLLDCAAYLRERIGPERTLVAWGTSFGGATVGTAIGRDEGRMIDYAVLDCPVGDARSMIEREVRLISEEHGIPYGLMMTVGEAFYRARLGFSFDDLDIARWVEQSDVPLLVFTSEADTLTPSAMAERLYRAAPTVEKRLIVVENSEHAKIYRDHPEQYRAALEAFLGTVAENKK